MATSTDPTEEALRREVLALNARAWGWACGLLGGVGLAVATLVLVLKGGPDVGAHLGLLANFFPGYRVTLGGAVLGFGYGFVTGYLTGRLIGAVYGRIAR